MSVKQSSVALALGVVTLLHSYAPACSIFMASDGKKVLVGNNEDWKDPYGKIRFVPPSDGRHGVVYFSHSSLGAQGGMNDQGLFFDYAATEYHPVTKSSGKPSYEGNIMDKIMRECATVEEALAVHDRYSLAFMAKFQTLICDATGDSALIEGDVVLRRRGNYQLTTNFYRSETPPEAIRCGRYKIAEAMLGRLRHPLRSHRPALRSRARATRAPSSVHGHSGTAAEHDSISTAPVASR